MDRLTEHLDIVLSLTLNDIREQLPRIDDELFCTWIELVAYDLFIGTNVDLFKIIGVAKYCLWLYLMVWYSQGFTYQEVVDKILVGLRREANEAVR